MLVLAYCSGDSFREAFVQVKARFWVENKGEVVAGGGKIGLFSAIRDGCQYSPHGVRVTPFFLPTFPLFLKFTRNIGYIRCRILARSNEGLRKYIIVSICYDTF